MYCGTCFKGFQLKDKKHFDSDGNDNDDLINEVLFSESSEFRKHFKSNMTFSIIKQRLLALVFLNELS